MSITFAVGDLTVHRVIESEGPLFDPLTFFPTLTKDLLAENLSWLRPTYIDPVSGQLMLCIQSYVVRTKHHNILIDSCVGNYKERPNYPFWNRMESDRYELNLAATGLTVHDIDYVMCTHMHVDHVGWNTTLVGSEWLPTFPRATYVFPQADAEYWDPRNAGRFPPHVGAAVNEGFFDDSVRPIVDAGRAQIVSGSVEVGPGLKLEPAPGHTPGSMTITLDGGGDVAIFSGDIVHHPLQVLNPDWNSIFCEDADEARRSRRRVLEQAAARGARLVPAHFAGEHSVRVERDGAGFRPRFES